MQFLYIGVSIIILIATGILYEYEKTTHRLPVGWDEESVLGLGFLLAITWPFALLMAGIAFCFIAPVWLGRYILTQFIKPENN
jgi:hypothetical protein